MSTTLYKKARRHLSSNCPVMQRVIAAVGPCTLTPNPADPFTLLVRCVVFQQISTKAADSIYARLLAAAGGGPSIPVARLSRLSESKFRACGVSGPKQRAIRAVIDHVRANPDLLPGIEDRDDDTVREQLTQISGIGPWSADMFLLFGLGRPDVWPVGDFGVRVAVKNQFRLRTLPDPRRMTKVGEPWKPYRSVAAWYLWRSLDLDKNGKK
jgi:DNA-3-methyladenine glycosylase II